MTWFIMLSPTTRLPMLSIIPTAASGSRSRSARLFGCLRQIITMEKSEAMPNQSLRQPLAVPMTSSQHAYEVRPRKNKRGFDLISDALPFGRLWYGERNAIENAVCYAKFYSRSHHAVIRIYDAAGVVYAFLRFLKPMVPRPMQPMLRSNSEVPVSGTGLRPGTHGTCIPGVGMMSV
jgi:hypothetical protein